MRQAGRYQRWRVINTGAAHCHSALPTLHHARQAPALSLIIKLALPEPNMGFLSVFACALPAACWQASAALPSVLPPCCASQSPQPMLPPSASSAGYKALVDLVVLDPTTLLPTNSCSIQLLA